MRIVFMGTPDAAVPTLQRILEDGHQIVAVWTQPDRPAGRGEKLHSSPIKQFAVAHGLKLEQPSKIKTPEAKELFASYNADAAVVVAYGRILPVQYLTAPRLGAINVHFSLLPKYRGAAPANWAIANGEVETGVTTMLIAEELDSGPILRQAKTKIGEMETSPELMIRLSTIGADLLSDTLKHLESIEPQPQNDDEATFAPILTKAHGVIDWSNSAAQIERAVRAFQPWPNAHTTFKGRNLIVWRAEVVNGEMGPAETGEVVAAHGDDLIVKAGEGSTLRLIEVQPEAKRRMPVRDFLNGAHLQIGERLGKV